MRSMSPSAAAPAASFKSPYTANLCPLFVWVELAGFREDFDESIGELVETILRASVVYFIYLPRLHSPTGTQ